VILLDVNVVLAAHRADHPHHAVVRPWFDELAGGQTQFWVPDVVWASFVRISTSSRIFAVPTPLDEAFGFLRAVRSHPDHVPLEPGEHHLVVFEDLCTTFDAAGELAVDAYLAALAIERGSALASLDRDFARFEDLEWIVPGRG
jgi:hypothetical protein